MLPEGDPYSATAVLKLNPSIVGWFVGVRPCCTAEIQKFYEDTKYSLCLNKISWI